MAVTDRDLTAALTGTLSITYNKTDADVFTDPTAVISETGHNFSFTHGDDLDDKVDILYADEHVMADTNVVNLDVSALTNVWGDTVDMTETKFLYVKNEAAIGTASTLDLDILTFDLPAQGWIMIGSPKDGGISTEIAGTGVLTLTASGALTARVIIMGTSE